MEKRRKEKATTRRRQGGFRRQVDANSQCLQHVRATAFRSYPAISMFDDTDATRSGYEHYRGRNVENPRPVSARSADVQQARTEQGSTTAIQQHINEADHFRRRFPLGVESTEKIGAFGKLNTFVKERLTCRDHVSARELVPETKFFR